MQAENIVTLYDVPNIWHIPLLLRVSSFFTASETLFAFFFGFTSYQKNKFQKKIIYYFFPENDQDQKAHEAILKGLNLLGFVLLTHSLVC